VDKPQKSQRQHKHTRKQARRNETAKPPHPAFGRWIEAQRLSADHLVLKLREEECGLGDIAYLGGIDGDVLNGLPSLGHEREAAFALVAEAAEQRVTGFRVDVEFAFAGFLHGHEYSRSGSFVTGVGEDRERFQVGPGGGQDELAGGGDVVGAAGQRAGDPQGDAGGGGERLDVAGVLVCLP